jgi:hypothetical protein
MRLILNDSQFNSIIIVNSFSILRANHIERERKPERGDDEEGKELLSEHCSMLENDDIKSQVHCK